MSKADTSKSKVAPTRRGGFADDFKRDAVRLIVEEEYSFKAAAKAVGVSENSHRSRLWKIALQELANELELTLRVCHFPPGTSKWNKIEHRLFSFITQNWRGKPLVSRQAIVELIGSTTTRKGLTVRAALDTHTYETCIKVSDHDLAQVKLKRNDFHGDWNYTIKPAS